MIEYISANYTSTYLGRMANRKLFFEIWRGEERDIHPREDSIIGLASKSSSYERLVRKHAAGLDRSIRNVERHSWDSRDGEIPSPRLSLSHSSPPTSRVRARQHLSLPTRGLILGIEPEKEGRLEERRENADTLTRYPTYPFAFSTCSCSCSRDHHEGVGGRSARKKTLQLPLCLSLSLALSLFLSLSSSRKDPPRDRSRNFSIREIEIFLRERKKKSTEIFLWERKKKSITKFFFEKERKNRSRNFSMKKKKIIDRNFFMKKKKIIDRNFSTREIERIDHEIFPRERKK